MKVNKKHLVLSLLFFGVVFMAGCAAGPNTAAHIAASDGGIAGFWLGLWHGMILPITFIVSLFSNDVNCYEVHNNGGWYNWGFLIGAAGTLAGSAASTSRK